MHALLLFALFQARPIAEPVRSGCSSDNQQIASAGPEDLVQVEMALAGDQQTCYRIVLTKPGQEQVAGYVLGEGLPAINVFVHRREKASEESAMVEARMARAAALKASASDPIKSTDPLVSTQFDDFAGRDDKGKPVSLSGFKGRVTIVTFWSPASPQTISQLERVLPLYDQYHKGGLNAVGVSMDPNPSHIQEALDDFSLSWPQMPDRSGLAARYHVDTKTGKTFVLDSSHRIIAAGPMGPEIVNAVRQLLAAPENQ
jgi:peroxiredoxin